MSYLGISLERVNEIHAVHAINPYTNNMIARKEGPNTILGKCFSSQLDMIKSKITVLKNLRTVI